MIEPPKEITVGKLFDRFIRESANREDRGENTIKNYETASKRFFDYFGAETMVHDVTHDDCLPWRKWLTTGDAYVCKGGYAKGREGYSEASCSGLVKRCSTVFSWAVKEKFIESNPFDGVKRGSQVNEERLHEITMSVYYKLLDACPNQEWRTLLALWRIGGLRPDCEPKELRWCDVNWEKGVMLVTSTKTARYSGKGSRPVPLFPELRVELKRQFDQAEEGGSPFVIPRLRNNANNSTQFRRIVKEAGLEGWERIRQNLRSSRSTEITNEFGLPTENAWIGHSKKVALDHYFKVPEAYVQKAIAPKETVPANDTTGIVALN